MIRIDLTRSQREIMTEFYNKPAMNVVFCKKDRTQLWEMATTRSNLSMLERETRKCPALLHQIQKSIETGDNIQSAVFSECVYAQTLANLFELKKFVNCYDEPDFIPEKVKKLIDSYSLFPRYAYSTNDKRRMLIQAGSCAGIDSALITVIDLTIYTIEFKEPYAKSSEPDLPEYGEDGKLVLSKKFEFENPQFISMVKEQIDKGLNFFENMGNNVHDFSYESIKTAISNNYNAKKFADVICTEDKFGYLTMLPINQIPQWANIEGEIRPSGRNSYKVWTPKALRRFLEVKGADVSCATVTIKESNLDARIGRGSGGKITGYKINPLFFVRVGDCTKRGNDITFDLSNVRQLRPTVAGKMNFKNLDYSKVKEFYKL